MTPEERESIRQDLTDYITSTLDEWLRTAHILQTSEDHDGKRVHINWSIPVNGSMIAELSEVRDTEPDFGQYGVTITVESLPDLPPIGPENDPALAYETEEDDKIPDRLNLNGDEEVWPTRPSEWVTAFLHFALAGDRIRINGQESKVLRSSAGVWYVNTADYWHPTPWKHTELRLDLEANPGFLEYPPNLECEILMTPERLAVYTMQQHFPGTSVIG